MSSKPGGSCLLISYTENAELRGPKNQNSPHFIAEKRAVLKVRGPIAPKTQILIPPQFPRRGKIIASPRALDFQMDHKWSYLPLK